MLAELSFRSKESSTYKSFFTVRGGTTYVGDAPRLTYLRVFRTVRQVQLEQQQVQGQEPVLVQELARLRQALEPLQQ